MTQFQASFTFEADTIEEAEAIVSTWEVTPGVVLMSLSGMVQALRYGPQPIPYGGSVAPAFAGGPPAPPSLPYAPPPPGLALTEQPPEEE